MSKEVQMTILLHTLKAVKDVVTTDVIDKVSMKITVIERAQVRRMTKEIRA